MLATTRPIGRAARVWLLWLALALAAAHSLAALHAYSHSIAEAADRSSSKEQGAGEPCALCIATAAIAGAPPAAPVLHLHRFAVAPPVPASPAARHESLQRQPYAIRAPPALTS